MVCCSQIHVYSLAVLHTIILKIQSVVLNNKTRYKSALRKYFRSQEKTVVFYERNYKTQHATIQVNYFTVQLYYFIVQVCFQYM